MPSGRLTKTKSGRNESGREGKSDISVQQKGRINVSKLNSRSRGSNPRRDVTPHPEYIVEVGSRSSFIPSTLSGLKPTSKSRERLAKGQNEFWLNRGFPSTAVCF